jgi:tricorn protease
MISPDGKTVAFRANYEGPNEVYTIPIEGGLPQRRTWDGDSEPEGWAPDGRLLVATERYSTLPSVQLVLVDEQGRARDRAACARPRRALLVRRPHALFHPLVPAVERDQALQGRLG